MEVDEQDLDGQDQSMEELNDNGPNLHKIKKKKDESRSQQIDKNDIDEMNKAAVIKNIGRSNWDDRFYFKRSRSGASCKISEIESFVYGGFSSRFQLMRKHINRMEPNQHLDLPFYCWECITIQTNKKSINLVIRDQKEMTKLLEFLIYQLKTVDGFRGTGDTYIKEAREQQSKRDEQKEEKLKQKLN